jgi:FtsZ-interacting cell division protein YlmF
MEDMSDLAKQMRDTDAILLNLEYLERNQAYRMMDIVSGIAYGMNYEIVPVSSHCCLILSQNAELIRDQALSKKFK